MEPIEPHGPTAEALRGYLLDTADHVLTVFINRASGSPEVRRLTALFEYSGVSLDEITNHWFALQTL